MSFSLNEAEEITFLNQNGDPFQIAVNTSILQPNLAHYSPNFCIQPRLLDQLLQRQMEPETPVMRRDERIFDSARQRQYGGHGEGHPGYFIKMPVDGKGQGGQLHFPARQTQRPARQRQARQRMGAEGGCLGRSGEGGEGDFG